MHFGFCWVNDSTIICFQNEIRDARSKLGHVDKKGWRKGQNKVAMISVIHTSIFLIDYTLCTIVIFFINK